VSGVFPTDTVRVGDELLFYNVENSRVRRANANDFNDKNNVILIHGFTAHGEYMHSIAETLANHGFQTFIFNYHSYRGIKTAAENLQTLLGNLSDLRKDKIPEKATSLVAHSMGGLVARAMCQLTPGKRYISKIVTLGTPHSGTLYNAELLGHMIHWGESISSKMKGFTPSSQSAKELTKKDNDGNGCLIDLLHESSKNLIDIQIFSVSGGKNWLEFGNFFKSFFANRKIQGWFGDKPNDGLVLEESSDVSNAVSTSNNNLHHYNNYTEFSDINHSYMIFNQQILLKVASWLKE
tara:strand:+ start:3295 stop:4176 length:882 start_codon:yes stop_codon:yes gene_type:complete